MSQRFETVRIINGTIQILFLSFLSVSSHISKTTCPNFSKFSMRVGVAVT